MNILEVSDIKKYYPVKKPFKPTLEVKALDGISFSIGKSQTIGIVGESGCGKSTLARQLIGLETPTAGQIKIEGRDLSDFKKEEFHSTIQMIFQDPYNSLNPRKKAWKIIAEPLLINSDKSKDECKEIALKTMEKVGLRKELADRYPHMFSGGQRQRIGIARALVLNPKILILDEPVSALDVSIQAQVLNLLLDLQEEFEFTYLFISHDLQVVKHISDDILVMYLGKVVEYGNSQKVFNDPIHPYTKALIQSSPSLLEQKSAEPISGELPSPLNPPSGCAFHKRCLSVVESCSKNVQTLKRKDDRLVACDQV